MAENLPRCIDVAKVCYDHPDPSICSAAEHICWQGVTSFFDGEADRKGGRNRFDITIPCEAALVCYAEGERIEEYLNTPKVWEALSVPKTTKRYNMTNMDVELAFVQTGDIQISTQTQVLYLLNEGVDVMLYQGNLDLACNTAGNLRWANSMPWKGQPEFASKSLTPWMSGEKKVGTFKEVQILMNKKHAKKTRFAFVTLNEAGHLVSHDR
jgi:cathepsin A (carboxypeptidase C)